MTGVTIEAKVVEIIGPMKVAINKGSDHSVKINDRFIVYSLGQELKDPDTGESLGKLEIVKGKARAVHIQPKLSTLETYEFEEQPTQTVTRREGGAVWPWLGSSTVTETEKQKKQFEGVEIGDLARKTA